MDADRNAVTVVIDEDFDRVTVTPRLDSYQACISGMPV